MSKTSRISVLSRKTMTENRSMRYAEVKCPRCGWVHFVLPLKEAKQDCPTDEALEDLKRCFNCHGPAVGFTPAKPEDSPVGCTLQPIVLRDT